MINTKEFMIRELINYRRRNMLMNSGIFEKMEHARETLDEVGEILAEIKSKLRQGLVRTVMEHPELLKNEKVVELLRS